MDKLIQSLQILWYGNVLHLEFKLTGWRPSVSITHYDNFIYRLTEEINCFPANSRREFIRNALILSQQCRYIIFIVPHSEKDFIQFAIINGQFMLDFPSTTANRREGDLSKLTRYLIKSGFTKSRTVDPEYLTYDRYDHPGLKRIEAGLGKNASFAAKITDEIIGKVIGWECGVYVILG